jgi:hypothetical protein
MRQHEADPHSHLVEQVLGLADCVIERFDADHERLPFAQRGRGRRVRAARCRSIVDAAESRGVFGVPTFVVEDTGELFWGADRAWLLEERLRELNLHRSH